VGGEHGEGFCTSTVFLKQVSWTEKTIYAQLHPEATKSSEDCGILHNGFLKIISFWQTKAAFH
jgi:hypothetical protein